MALFFSQSRCKQCRSHSKTILLLEFTCPWHYGEMGCSLHKGILLEPLWQNQVKSNFGELTKRCSRPYLENTSTKLHEALKSSSSSPQAASEMPWANPTFQSLFAFTLRNTSHPESYRAADEPVCLWTSAQAGSV